MTVRASTRSPAAPDPGLTDRDVAVYALKAGYGVRGASLGSQGAEAVEFRDDMLAFWRAALHA